MSSPNPTRTRLARLRGFVTADHRYVFLGTSVVALVGLWFGNQPHSPLSFLAASYALESVLYYLLLAWVALSVLALVSKLAHWKGDAYESGSPFCRPFARRAERYASYAVWAVALAFVADRLVMGTVSLVGWAIAQPTNPTDFLGSMAYMLYNMWPTFVQGIVNTVIIALVGTVVAFFLALALVFLRVQEPDRSDNDFVRLMKVVGAGFAKLYSQVVRGTPMMIQGLIIYYAGTGALAGQGMSALAGSLAMAGHAQGRVPTGHQELDPGAVKRARHQHKGLVGPHGDRRARTHVCHAHHRGRVLQADGGLRGRRRRVPDPDGARVVAAWQVWQAL